MFNLQTIHDLIWDAKYKATELAKTNNLEDHCTNIGKAAAYAQCQKWLEKYISELEKGKDVPLKELLGALYVNTQYEDEY